MDRLSLINGLIKKHNYQKYLEIGIREGYTIHSVIAPEKESVDPCYECQPKIKCDNVMTSDAFFKIATKTYDIIFIDGDHTDQTVIRDVYNSLNHLSSGGTLVLHDCNPLQEDHQTPVTHAATWNGTVWRAVAHFRTNPNLFVCVIDTDSGLGIIKPGSQAQLKLPYNVDWKYFEQNRKQILNLLTVEEYEKNGY